MPADIMNDDGLFGLRATDIPIEEDATIKSDNKTLIAKSQDFYFEVRGSSINDNSIIDASSNLIALILRVKGIVELDEQNVISLYAQVRDEISTIQTELQDTGKYDKAILTTSSYVLCTVIDEFILSTTWGRESHWSQNSLLSVFHGEVYGGEKIYKILARLQMEPELYRDLIELMYFFLCLGYRGRYALEANGEKKSRVILKDLTTYMRKNYSKPERPLTQPELHIVDRSMKMRLDIPNWFIVLLVLFTLIILFIVFDNTLTDFVNETLEEIKVFHVEE